jgi:tRNA(His) 5'-end guanylyltransferase
MDTMDLTAMYLCENIMGAQVAYVQSDEISILLHDYKTLQSEAWYDYNQQKVTSVSASMAGAYFTKESWRIWSDYRKPYYSLLYDSQHLATFDSRAFNLPEAEVCNYFIWRQLDCVRNSINSLGQSHYSARQLHGKSQSDVQEMCFQAGYNWNDLPTAHRRGRCIVKVNYDYEGTTRSKWIVDSEIPKFTEDREYIERYLKSES